jgi:hypothetical protein
MQFWLIRQPVSEDELEPSQGQEAMSFKKTRHDVTNFTLMR